MEQGISWDVFGGVAFTDSGGSDAYEDALGRVMEWLRSDCEGRWREWFDNDRFGDLLVDIVFRRSVKREQTRVSIHKDGYVQATRTARTEAYFGLRRDAMVLHACGQVSLALAAVAKKLDLADPPMNGPTIYAALDVDRNVRQPPK